MSMSQWHTEAETSRRKMKIISNQQQQVKDLRFKQKLDKIKLYLLNSNRNIYENQYDSSPSDEIDLDEDFKKILEKRLPTKLRNKFIYNLNSEQSISGNNNNNNDSLDAEYAATMVEHQQKDNFHNILKSIKLEEPLLVKNETITCRNDQHLIESFDETSTEAAVPVRHQTNIFNELATIKLETMASDEKKIITDDATLNESLDNVAYSNDFYKILEAIKMEPMNENETIPNEALIESIDIASADVVVVKNEPIKLEPSTDYDDIFNDITDVLNKEINLPQVECENIENLDDGTHETTAAFNLCYEKIKNEFEHRNKYSF